MNKKLKRLELKRLVEKSIIRDEEKKRIGWSATTSVKEVLRSLNSTLNGLDDVQIRRNRMIYGKNQKADDIHKNIIQVILESLNQPTCNVIRKDVNLINIPSKELVVGDIVHLSEGDIVPADLRVIESNGLTVDETPINKDRKSIIKNAGICLCELENVTDYQNIVLMGCNVTKGTAEAVVLSVGSHTIFEIMN